MVRDFFFLTMLLLIHELGHFITGLCLGWKVDKIYFYPYGGLSKFKEKVNVPLWQEALVLLMGPVMQWVGYFLLLFLFSRSQDIVAIRGYHYGLLFFNLLPIYPLDGGKLVLLLFCIVAPFKKALTAICVLSSLVLGLVFLYLGFSWLPRSMWLLISFLALKLYREMRHMPYYYQRFLLERYLYPVSFRRLLPVQSLSEMKRSYRHLFREGTHFITEKEKLRTHFMKSTMKHVN